VHLQTIYLTIATYFLARLANSGVHALHGMHDRCFADNTYMRYVKLVDD